MNIKSLLLGSAAALVAVSGARAADAIVVAEPEPAEYVRICDVYGAGYFYIPGTETCLRVGGYLRYDIGVGDLNGHTDVLDRKDDMRGNFDTNDTYYKRMRAQLQLDARSETEYGTLRGYMAIDFNRFDDHRGGSGASIDHALIQLGGLTIGYSDSLFESLTDSAGTVINDGYVNYTPGKSHQISYTFDGGNGFSATIGVEEGTGEFVLDSYVPHVVAGASYTQGWGKIAGVIAYDSVYEKVAGKLRVDVNVNDALTLWVMGGYQDWDWQTAAYVNGGGISGIDHNGGSYYGVWGGDWAVWGGGQYRFNEKTALDVQLSYDDLETFGAVVGLRHELVHGFVIRPEVSYASWKNYDAVGNKIGGKDDGWGGFLRFQRSF
ncbi:porin [Aquamicrobium sp. NLF2-7]|uniref:porin n=1 Tax=Aquamicrobium sp. NLF2-7 TaxID=2918753 RepID=UPI001EFA3CCD|nr:porin [Aquamicrobium sp. NLF2-7]MCG8271764.1 porin [Aquamicrobium sp. NLF2-7]